MTENPSAGILFEAVQSGNAEMVKTLLKAGADPNIRDATGQTPLHVAVANGQTEIAKLLMEKTKMASSQAPLANSLNFSDALKNMFDIGPGNSFGGLYLVFSVLSGVWLKGTFGTQLDGRPPGSNMERIFAMLWPHSFEDVVLLGCGFLVGAVLIFIYAFTWSLIREYNKSKG